MEKSKKKKFQWQNLIGIAFFSIIGMICGILTIEYMDSLETTELNFGEKMLHLLFLLIIMYISFFIQMIIHEAGHFIFGSLTGYKLSSFRIGSFMWIKDNGKIKLKKYSLAGTGGQCLMSPPDMVNDKIPIVLYNLGGCIMNIITGVIALVIFFLFRDNSLLSVFMLMITIVGFAFAIMNGVPIRLGLIDNDGYNALSLGKNTQALRSFWIQMKINDLILKGDRLKDIPEEWFALPTDEEMKNSMISVIGVFACNRLMDEHRFDETENLIKHYLEVDTSMVGIHRSLLICDYIFCQLIRNRNRQDIEKMLDKQQKSFMQSMKKNPTIIRTEYACALLLENDSIKAEKIKQQFEKCVVSYPYTSDIESERELINIAEEYYKTIA